MEACIVICRTNKPVSRRGKILFINAKSEVTRKNSQSYLDDTLIKKIARTYIDYLDLEGFSRVVSLDEIIKNSGELTISLYVTHDKATPAEPVEVSLGKWIAGSANLHKEYDRLLDQLQGV